MNGSKLRRHLLRELFVLAMLLPGFAIYLVFFLVPSAQSFPVALTSWQGFTTANIRFVGLSNFRHLLFDNVFLRAIVNNLFIIIAGGLLTIVIGLFMANTFSRRDFFGRDALKSIVFFPYSVSVVAVGLMWSFLLAPNIGLVDYSLQAIGLGKLAIVWLGSRWSALGSMTFITVWWTLGFYVTLLMAGMKRIPRDYYDAARIDGASEMQQFVHVTVPLLREILLITVIYIVMQGWQSFGVIYIMTKGGPGNLTQTIATYMIWTSLDADFGAYRMGYGTAMAVVLFLIVGLTSVVYRFMTRREAVQY